MGHWLRDVCLLSHGLTFYLGSVKVCSSAIFETYALLPQIYMVCCNWLLVVLLLKCPSSLDTYILINKFYNFVIFSVIINAVILLLNYLALILYFLFLKHYLDLYITNTLCCESLLIFVLLSCLLYLMVLKTIFSWCGVRAKFYCATIAYRVGLNAVFGWPQGIMANV